MAAQTAARSATGMSKAKIVAGAGLVILVALMAIDTTYVVIGSEDDVAVQGFQPRAFGESNFPEIQQSVQTRAVPAPELAEAVLADQTAAGEKYGVGEGFGPVVPVSLTGTVGEGKSGIYTLSVEGVSDEIAVRIQTGPAINGTDLRDSTGNINFGQFTNQIEYQDAGQAINDVMKEQVLSGIDAENLTGETVNVTGVFKLINPKNWFITPVQMSVQ